VNEFSCIALGDTLSSSFASPCWRETLFEQILADDFDGLDPTLAGSVSLLKKRGAHRCWHKHSTFLDHLLGVHNILRLWGQGQTIGRVGLFHSAYSNSYVNLALFDSNDPAERKVIQDTVGQTVEELVHMFCIINRQNVVVETLLKNGYIPPEGIEVPHLRKPNQKVYLSSETLRMLIVFTMADMSDQYFGWQDRLFGGDQMLNSMLAPDADDLSTHESTAIWPGLSQPGLWMSYMSELGAIAKTFVSVSSSESPGLNPSQDDRRLDLPPVFDNCTKLLLREDEAKARDLYWGVITGEIKENDELVIETLKRAVEHNPWAFEPYVVLSQKYLHLNDFDRALTMAGRALDLQQQWGTAWDKRLSFQAWVAWTRVMYQRAEDKLEWPKDSWSVINLGLVR